MRHGRPATGLKAHAFQNRTGRMQQREKAVGNQSGGTSRLRPCRPAGPQRVRERDRPEREENGTKRLTKGVRVQSHETCHPSLDYFPPVSLYSRLRPCHPLSTRSAPTPVSNFPLFEVQSYSPSALVVHYITARFPEITDCVHPSIFTTRLLPTPLSTRYSPTL